MRRGTGQCGPSARVAARPGLRPGRHPDAAAASAGGAAGGGGGAAAAGGHCGGGGADQRAVVGVMGRCGVGVGVEVLGIGGCVRCKQHSMSTGLPAAIVYFESGMRVMSATVMHTRAFDHSYMRLYCAFACAMASL